MGGRYHITQLRLMQEQAEEILASYQDQFDHPITVPVQPAYRKWCASLSHKYYSSILDTRPSQAR